MERLRRLAQEQAAEIAALRRLLAERDMDGEAYRRLLEGATDDAIIATGLDGRVTEWNSGARNITGWSREEALGQPIDVIFLPEQREAGVPRAEMREALAAGRASGDRWYRRRDGTRFWGRGSLTPLRDAEGRPVGFLRVLRDRTEHQQAIEELQALDERYRLAARAAKDAIWDWDLGRNHVRWNEALQTAYGHAVREAESSGDWWINHIHPDDRARVHGSIRAVIEGAGTNWAEEYRFIRADGTYADVLDRGFVLRDAEGRALRAIGAMLDLTEQKATGAALRISEDRLRLATAAARIGIFDYRVQENLLTWDARCNELFGLPPDEPVTYLGTFLPGLHPEDRERSHAAVLRALDPAGPGTFDVEYRVIGLRDGIERWIAAKGSTFFEHGLAVRLIGTVLDITGVKRAEAQLRELNDTLEQRVEARTRALAETEAALRQSHKMEAVGQLTGGLAHDFNNLLTGIIGSLEVTRARIAQGRVQGLEAYLDAGLHSANRAASLTHRLLAFSRQQTLDPRPVDANHLIESMSDLIRRSIGPAIDLQLMPQPDLWTTLCDPNQLENALLNLAINARDAMPEGGCLTIATANAVVEEDAAPQDVPASRYVVISVSDTGTGMAPDVAARAFDPFFTTKPQGHGTGLGLSMIYGFAHQSGGHAKLSSEAGAGTTVRLFLPYQPGRADAAGEEAPQAAPATARTNQRILVVDDEPVVRVLLTEALQDAGYETLEAEDGVSGLAALRAAGGLDLLVTDVGMPGGMNGRQMAEAAQRLQPGLKVLFITGYARHGVLEAGLQVLTKPFTLDALTERVQAILAGPDGAS